MIIIDTRSCSPVWGLFTKRSRGPFRRIIIKRVFTHVSWWCVYTVFNSATTGITAGVHVMGKTAPGQYDRNRSSFLLWLSFFFCTDKTKKLYYVRILFPSYPIFFSRSWHMEVSPLGTERTEVIFYNDVLMAEGRLSSATYTRTRRCVNTHEISGLSRVCTKRVIPQYLYGIPGGCVLSTASPPSPVAVVCVCQRSLFQIHSGLIVHILTYM